MRILKLIFVLRIALAAGAKNKGKKEKDWKPASVDITAPQPAPDSLETLKSGGKFGLGVLVGSRTGLSAKLWPKRRHSLSLDLGSTNFTNTISFTASYQFHAKLIRAPEHGSSAQLYFGIGGRARVLVQASREDPNDEESATVLNTTAVIGLRLPIGFSFLLAGFPIELFIEAAPAVDFWQSLGFDLEGQGGARIYF